MHNVRGRHRLPAATAGNAWDAAGDPAISPYGSMLVAKVVRSRGSLKS
jgi:hypothetical protein